MNTIKFSNIYDMRKETSDVSTYSIEKIKIGKKVYEYFSDTQICLYVTKSCNAACRFCINNYNDSFSLCCNINEKEYLTKLEKYLDLFGDKKPYITITGGEPTKDKKLIPILKLLKKKGYKIRTFATNGSGLLDEYDGKIIMDYLIDIYVNSINISRAHYSDEVNDELMKLKKGQINNEMLERIGRISKIKGLDSRMSCILLKDGINDLESLLTYKDFYNDLGISTVMFRELIETQNEKYNSMKVDLKNIFDEIKKNKSFKYLKTLDGMYYKVDIYRYKDELVKCYTEKHTAPSNIIRDFFIYPDMKLLDGYNETILME